MKCINFLFVSFIFAEIVDWPRANKFWRLTSDRRKPTYHTSLPSGSPPNLYPADQHRQLAGPRDLRSRIANGQSFPASSPILQLRGTVARHRAAAATAESPPNAQTESGSLLDTDLSVRTPGPIQLQKSSSASPLKGHTVIKFPAARPWIPGDFTTSA